MLTGQQVGGNLSATGDVRRNTLLLMVTAHQEHVGAAIRKRRNTLGISPAEFQRKLNISNKTHERWERGETGGAITHIDQVAKALKTTPELLMAKPTKKSNGTPLPFGADDDLRDLKALLHKVLDRLPATAAAAQTATAEPTHQIDTLPPEKGSRQAAQDEDESGTDTAD